MESSFPTYPKVYGPYRRHVDGPDKNKLIIGSWSKPEFEALSNLTWVWSEKIDGTNIRVHYDGHKVQFGGRTDNAQIPAKLVTRLNELFPEELFEQVFQDTAVTLFGEGYGAGIQKGGGKYKSDGVDFVLFDVLIDRWWLLREAVEGIAAKMGLQVVPVVLEGTVHEAIQMVEGTLTSSWTDKGRICDHLKGICYHEEKEFTAEGLVGTTKEGLLSRDGKRIQMKVKTEDFT